MGLDLSADRIDMEQPLPALLVAEVDFLAGPEQVFEEGQTRYLCLSADNRHAPICSSAFPLHSRVALAPAVLLPAMPKYTQLLVLVRCTKGKRLLSGPLFLGEVHIK